MFGIVTIVTMVMFAVPNFMIVQNRGMSGFGQPQLSANESEMNGGERFEKYVH